MSSVEDGEQEELNVLFHAAQLGRTDIVKNAIASLRETKSHDELLALLSASRPEDGATLMHIGASSGHPDVIRALLNTGVDANIVPTTGVFAGKTAYQAAEPSVLQAFHVYLFEKIALGQEDVICNLLDSGIAVDLRDSSTIDDSTLHWACSFGNAPVVAALLSRGCPVNILNNSKQTPFHLACKNGSRDVVELLLANGANALFPDNTGKLAADLIPQKHKDLLEVIVMHVAGHPDQHQSPTPVASHTTNADNDIDCTVHGPVHDISPVGDEDEIRADPPPKPYVSDRPAQVVPDVTSHLILWPPPQRQRMLPISAFEGEGGGADGGASSAPEYGIVFTSARPVVISYCMDHKSALDMSCVAEICGLTQALHRFGLGSVVLRSPATADIRLSVNASLCPGHHRYSVNVCPSFISVTGSDREGLLYGVYTLVQIAQLHSEFGVLESDSEDFDRDRLQFDLDGYSPASSKKTAGVIRTLTIPCVSIEDWPDFPSRGITWSYDAAALTNMDILHTNISMLSRLRINKLLMLVDCLDHGSTPERSEAVLSERRRDTILCGSRIYYIERLCQRYLIDIVPVVKVPCFCSERSSGDRHLHNRLNVDALRCFSSPIIHIEFVSADDADCADGVGSADVVRSCRLALKCVRAAGFTSVVVRCTSAFQRMYDPISVAAHVGLQGVYGDIDSFTDQEDPQHILSPHLAIREAELRCRCDFEQGKTLSIGPGFVENAILYPMILVKFKCFLHSGFCWNQETVMDIIGTSSDIQMLEEVINLILLDGNGGGTGGALSDSSTTAEVESLSSMKSSAEGSKENGMRKFSSADGLRSIRASAKESPIEASSGFLFWRKQVSSDSLAPIAGSSSIPGAVPSMSHSDFLMSLMTCNSGSFFEPPRGVTTGTQPKIAPIFEFVEVAARGSDANSNRLKSPKRGRTLSKQSSSREELNSSSFAESESIFWRFLAAKSYAEFVTCGSTRPCNNDANGDVDGVAPSKAQALEVLKYYRRALSSVGWKLDRKKMADLRDKGMSGDNFDSRAQWGADVLSKGHNHSNDESEVFVYDNCSTNDKFPFPSFRDARFWNSSLSDSARPAKGARDKTADATVPASAADESRSDSLLNIEEIYVALHLVCTLCRAIILGYNAYEKMHPGMDGKLLKFSELVAILPTGSTSDVANALLEGIEYGMMLWNRRFERLSFRVRRGGSISGRDRNGGGTDGRGDRTAGDQYRDEQSAAMGPAIPGIGAFYWISQNLPQQVEDLFFNTLTMLQRNNCS